MKMLTLFRRPLPPRQPWPATLSPETSAKLLALGIANSKPKSALE